MANTVVVINYPAHKRAHVTLVGSQLGTTDPIKIYHVKGDTIMLRFVDKETGEIIWERSETGETFYLSPNWDEQMATREWENDHLAAQQLGHDEELRHKALSILKRTLEGERRDGEWVIVLPSSVQISWLTQSGSQSYVTTLYPSNFDVPFLVNN